MFRKSYIGVVIVLFAVAILSACSGSAGSGGRNTIGTGTVNLGFSDPPTCGAPNGSYNAVYITVTDVKIHTSSTAAENDSGWVDLTPGMTPKQINLLGQTDSRCLLATLGQGKQITAGHYQQVRVYLAPDNISNQIAGNACGNASNCVVLADSSVHALQMSSEVQTGIKIPSGQLAGGAFQVGDGETKDLVIDFDACASIVVQGGQWRLKPVLHAGEVQLAATIQGKLTDSITHASIGGTAIISLQRKDASGIDRVVLQTKADAAGNFVLCPVPAGAYDLVATAVTNTNVAYAATIITGVAPGATFSEIPMIAQTGTTTSPASIAGQVTTTKAPAAATPADITVSALQQITAGGSTYSVTIPLAQQQASTLSIATAAGACPANTDCASYTLSVPAMWPNIGAYSTGTITFAQSTATPVAYELDAQAFVQGSGGTQDCSPSVLSVITLAGGGNINVTPGANLTATTFTFAGCQ
jgi:hypothetical protein